MLSQMYDKFTSEHEKAMIHVQSVFDNLEIKEDDYCGEKTFKILAKFFLTKDYNSYGEVANWGGFDSHAINMSSFLSNLHHACVDDGDISCVYSKVHGTILVFGNPYDYESEEKFIELNCSNYYKPEDCEVFGIYEIKDAERWMNLKIKHQEVGRERNLRVRSFLEKING